MNIAVNNFKILNCALSIAQFTVSGLGAVKKLMVKLPLPIHNDGTVRFRDVRTLPSGSKNPYYRIQKETLSIQTYLCFHDYEENVEINSFRRNNS